MKRLISTLTIVAAAALCLPAAVHADEFGIDDFDVAFTDAKGSPTTQAGSHPFAMTTSFRVKYTSVPPFGIGIPNGRVQDLLIEQVVGFTGDATAIPVCSTADFLLEECALETVVGIHSESLLNPFFYDPPTAVYNLQPPPGSPTRLGFIAHDIVPVVLDIGVKDAPEHNLIAATRGVNETVAFLGSVVQIWGVPGDPEHDVVRGTDCARSNAEVVEQKRFAINPGSTCPANSALRPFLTLPRACTGPAITRFEARPWEEPGEWVSGSVETHDDAEPPNPQGFTGCGKLGFTPRIVAEPTSKSAQSPTGLDFSLNIQDDGLTNATGLADSDIRKAVVTLPEGMSTNPSLAEGLGVCTEGDLENETLKAFPGEGCPDSSKIGSLEVESPLVDETVKGSLFIAEPYENEFGSLLAMYIVLKNERLGILVKQPAKIESDPKTGQLTTVVDNIPQLPFSRFKLHFREGVRSPLATPSACGDYDAKAVLYPWSGAEPITTLSTFEILTGPGGDPCPSGGLPPFHPGLIAGTLNNAAGRFSPFNVRLFRSDGEQEITHFSIKLPPGIVGKLAGIPFCPDAAIVAAKARTGPHGGDEELQAPSCPAASEIGRTLAGSGVGPALAYAPGKIYLAGPYRGSVLSIVAITAAKVGPFDLGTVVVRFALKIDPETAEVFIDATGSDPIPHIIHGIPVHLRDIRAYNDRPEFVLNPTDCTRTSTASTVLGAGLNFASEADDNPLTVSTPFQAADCAALPFKPKLSLKLVGGTRRGAHPKLVANLKMNGIGEAAIQRAQVTLPRSEFLENAHIKTICTRVQFKAGGGNGEQCPAASVYGHAKAVTPILDEPLEGPIYLRSSEHQLPDLVAAFHNGRININLVGRIDSVKGGGIRNTFEAVPDAPVTSATFVFQGKGKGLLVNSTNLCKGIHRATVEFDGHNGKIYDTKPALRAKCPKAKKHRRHARGALGG